jgi:type III restriction enzyme
MNLKSYFADFVAIDDEGIHWLLEAKGQENIDVIRKDNAATRWCENATKLTRTPWRYVKVPQKDYEALQPNRLADLVASQPVSLF